MFHRRAIGFPTQYEILGKSRRQFRDFTDVLERVFFVDGQLTVDVIASEVGISRADLFGRTRERLRGCDCTVAEFNDALYGVLASAADRSIAGDKTPDYCPYTPLLQVCGLTRIYSRH